MSDEPNPKIRSVTLDHPIKRGDDLIEKLQLRKPGAGELRGLSLIRVAQMEVDDLRKLLPRITIPVLTDHEVGLIESEDLMAIASELSDFLLTRRMREELGTM
ncbi:MAG: phage-related tail protein [Novosphingobium sp.]|nr:phage-related tail protein [Novosphingobium sp.]